MKNTHIGLVEKTATRSKPSHLDLKGLKDLVRAGEGLTLEFKLKANHPEKIIREVVAFANTHGGVLLVGVGDDKTIPGLKFADEEEYILVRAIDKFCTPPLSYQVERFMLSDDREVLIFKILASDDKPHFAIIDPLQDIKKAYVRIADRSVQASKEMRQILKWQDKVQHVQFKYGKKEEILLKYLGENPSGLTLKAFAQLAHIPLWLASKTLITLVLANVIKIIPDEIEDWYVMKG